MNGELLAGTVINFNIAAQMHSVILMPMRRSPGFSLLEIAVVLAIIGLLVGGVVAGQDMLRNSKMRSVARDGLMFQTVLGQFRQQYGSLPGDLINAASYFGCTNCNGDGDGVIDNHGADAAIAANRYEDSVVMLHLASAGLIQGAYTGDYVSAAGRYISPTDNAYAGKIARTSFAIARPDIWGATAGLKGKTAICLSYNNRTMTCVGPQTATNYYDLYGQDGWSIDSKVDDGSARTGNLIADSCHILANHWGFDDIQIYRSTNADLEYDRANSVYACGLMFLY